ncbi:alkaline phosphatase family protein [Leptolyngbya cf. ectocarpi LEGE 11479]|uniref:Alkaline phosphatase family protein n=1 Tax=Leptolyngbya cf. ectocarpi LEGE 11479 TaxID=1828722 RepID=A0A928X2F0_LEPEC|nr:alkaline phosphatase family protein [Leptolyngbya ectocarpi]MBE9066620.1 alkaline phosphatase family protein [Leptolyngbya cf. ectocarpi LEGE 11479]
MNKSRFILVFLDGLGLGPASPHNPLSDPATMPRVQSLCGTPWLSGAHVQRPHFLLKPIDATLGVPGLPQSATGQTTLYTGHNAAKFRGQHQTGFANGSLRQLIEPHGLFKRVLAQGGTATLANLYSPAYFEAIAQRRWRYSVCTLLNMTAGLPFRMQYEYEQGKALFWDITGEIANSRGIAQAPITPELAGNYLATLGNHYSVTLFECYLSDYAGHSQIYNQAISVLQRIDRFLAAVINHLAVDTTLIVVSDHGNVEDLSTKRHTLNAVPLWVVGPAAQDFTQVQDLTGITPTILAALAPTATNTVQVP